MLAVSGLMFGGLWLIFWLVLLHLAGLSSLIMGFFMTIFTLSLTGGLHLDGLMDTSDAIFSHRDRQTRLAILSDTHAGSFAVMGCAAIILAKTLLFSELLTLSVKHYTLFTIPIYSRLGMALLLNNLPFAKQDGLAVSLGACRQKRDNIFFAAMMIILLFTGSKLEALIFAISLIFWVRVCMKIFGGITGDLLGAFVELSEVIILTGTVISECI